jgi:hypothetical protein
MTLKRFLKAKRIGSLILAVIVPIFIAEGSLHIHHRAISGPRAADYYALQNHAAWQPAVLKTTDGILLRGWFFRPA